MTMRQLLAAVLIGMGWLTCARADEAQVAAAFEALRDEPARLRRFLFDFPKGGDLQAGLAGGVYAESIIRWASEDGLCVTPHSGQLSMPPCDEQRPTVKSHVANGANYRRLVDAYSVRGPSDGSSAGRTRDSDALDLYRPATLGRQADMLDEVLNWFGTQNTTYVELLQPLGMDKAREWALAKPSAFSGDVSYENGQWARDADLLRLLASTRAALDRIEAQRTDARLCGRGVSHPPAACSVRMRYLASVRRDAPEEQVNAQLALAFLLAKEDPRYAGVQVSGPEDEPAARNRRNWVAAVIRRMAATCPTVPVSLDAGALAPGQLPPEEMRDSITAALNALATRRVGHAVAIGQESNGERTLASMAAQRILVNIHLTGDAMLLGAQGPSHPFLLYHRSGVPVALTAGSQGLLRIDLTQEYVRATQEHRLRYADLKQLSRNALAYSFLKGESLLLDTRSGERTAQCRTDAPGGPISQACRRFLASSDKAAAQMALEHRFHRFESREASTAR